MRENRPRLVDISRRYRYEIPRVIRPDIILTDGGYAISELDSVPGGIGLTGWLNQTYRELGFDVLGGGDGMINGFQSILPTGVIAVSKESETYRPEMEWLCDQLTARYGARWSVAEAETWDFRSPEPLYRFFEMFDLPNLPSRDSLIEAAESGNIRMTPPLKPYLEEKLWFGLFWSRPLQKFWRRELRASHWAKLKSLIPQTWVMDPAPVPHHAVIPGAGNPGLARIEEVQSKAAGIRLESERIFGVGMGQSRSLCRARSSPKGMVGLHRTSDYFLRSGPFILQKFFKGRLVEQPFYNPATNSIETLVGRVRLCPYYFVLSENEVRLGGALATIVPADKKIVHGMRDAIMVPTAVELRSSESGNLASRSAREISRI